MLGTDLAAGLVTLRAEAESRMTDVVRAGLFKDGTDPDTGDPTRVLVMERYAGKARIRWGSREVAASVAASTPIGVQEPYLSVPFGSARIPVGDEVAVESSEDSLVIGMTFRVVGKPVAGAVTAHRYPLEQL